jgi:hypothetical protein
MRRAELINFGLNQEREDQKITKNQVMEKGVGNLAQPPGEERCPGKRWRIITCAVLCLSFFRYSRRRGSGRV